MTNRFLTVCWSASVGLALCIFTTFYFVGSSRYANQPFDPEITRLTSRTVAIGSSITGHAFPLIFSNDDSSLLKDGTRWTVPSISVGETLDLLERALEQDIDLVLLEVGPLVRVINVGYSSESLLQNLLKMSKEARFGLKSLFTNNFRNFQKEFDRELMQSAFRPTKDFKEHVRYSVLDWKQFTEIKLLVDQARSKNITIVLLSYPRARSSLQTYYYRADLEKLREEITQFAEFYDIANFSPDLLWDDAFFIDQLHFNSTGRERFLKEIEVWSAGR